jgi:hypothetical protein
MAGNMIVPINEDFGAADVVKLFDSGEIDKAQFIFEFADKGEIARRIEEQELAAGSWDELAGAGGTISGKDYTGKPFKILAVHWNPTDEGNTEGLGLYAVMDAVDMNGQQLTLTCGARSVVRKVAIAAAREWLPVWAKLTSTKVDKGYALDLTSVSQDELPFE